jgi:16S rRNA (guanine(1405)-N(7))-methyltransferase
MSDARLADVVAALSASRKYAHLCPETLARVARWALLRHAPVREATKAAKRKLHQVYGAYANQLDLQRLAALVEAVSPVGNASAFAAACRELLACHTSTAERLPFVEELYPTLFAHTGVPASLADLACGLNPCAVPWMGLAPGTRYVACDIDRRIVEAASRLLAHAGVDGTVECRDVLVHPPEWAVDVALLLKSAPCLEQQEKGATLRVLRAVQAKHLVVSYPAQSLSGRGKGMRATFEAQARRLAEALGAETQRLDYPTETLYVLMRR